MRKNQFKVDRQVVNAPIPKPAINRPLRSKKPATVAQDNGYGSRTKMRDSLQARSSVNQPGGVSKSRDSLERHMTTATESSISAKKPF